MPLSLQHYADIAQLVERQLPKLKVASSNLVVRSINLLSKHNQQSSFILHQLVVRF